MIEHWVWVNLPYACYGIRVENGRVVDAPPIAYWMVGKDERVVAGWLRRKGAVYKKLEIDR